MTWLIPKDQKRLSLFLMLAILAGILIMLFPIWPLSVKLVIWYISFYLLVFLVGLIVVRAIVWTIFFIFGLDFWIFPNLLEDTYYVLDTFKPFYSFGRRQDGMRMFLVRVITLACAALGVYQLVQEPEHINSFTTETTATIDELFEWGNQRFVVGGGNNNQTLVDPNRPKNAQDIFAEAVFEEMEERKKYSEEE
jgi:translocation protein SEC62